MSIDLARAAVIAGTGDGIIARFPGVLCVAHCPDRSALVRLLDVCAAAAGPDPGRALARRLATWMGGPDAPDDDLVFGTVATAGAQLGVFLVGAAELTVPEESVTLSGADAATWTDRLIAVPGAPVVLGIDGVAPPTGITSDLNDLRSGVVPGAGVVLFPPVPPGAPQRADRPAADATADGAHRNGGRVGSIPGPAAAGYEWFADWSDRRGPIPSSNAGWPWTDAPVGPDAPGWIDEPVEPLDGDPLDSGRHASPDGAGGRDADRVSAPRATLSPLAVGSREAPTTRAPAAEADAGQPRDGAEPPDPQGSGAYPLAAPDVSQETRAPAEAAPDADPSTTTDPGSASARPGPDPGNPPAIEPESDPGFDDENTVPGQVTSVRPPTPTPPTPAPPTVIPRRPHLVAASDPEARPADAAQPDAAGPRPALGRIVFDDGATFTVDAEYLVGRMPEADPPGSVGELRPIVVEDRSGSVSRVHAEILIKGWDVVLVDSGSRNGTFVAGPDDEGWTAVAPGHTSLLLPGTRVRMGGRTFVFEPTA